MIGQTLVLVCAALGLAAGSCIPIASQGCSSNVVVPDISIGSGNCGCGIIGSGITSGVVGGITSGVVGGISSGVVGGISSGVVGGISSGMMGSGFSGLDGNFNGPETAPLPVLQAPSVTLPTVESPVVTLSAPAVPAPRVIASRCVCTKTVVKPQVFQRVVTVPKVQRYFKRTVTPVVENLIYKSRPITGNGYGIGGSGFVGGNGIIGSGFVGGNGIIGSGMMGSGCSSPVVVTGCTHSRVC